MLRQIAAGPTVVEPLPGAAEGDRMVRVAVAPEIVIEIPLSKEFLDTFLIPRLSMSNEDLLAEITKDEARERAHEAAAGIVLPPDIRG